MNSYDELVAVFQVGTSRAAVPPSELLGDQPTMDMAHRALVLAGTLDLIRRTGASPVDGIPPIPESPIESSRVATRSADPLGEALAGHQTNAILEWAAKAARVGKVAPEVALIKLLGMAPKHAAIVPILGARGRWLAELQGLDLDASAKGSLPVRRQHDPVGFRDWLAAEFDSMDWKERAQAIAVMHLGVSLEDEPVLARALADRRKEVREPAVAILAGLDRSGFANQISAASRGMLLLEKSFLRKSLSVIPPEPEDLPKPLPRTTSFLGFGPMALALFDLLRYIPPKRWERELGLSPSQILDFAERTDYTRALVDGLEEAAVRFEDLSWIEAFFLYRLSHDPSHSRSWNEITQHVSDEVFERNITARLADSGKELVYTSVTLCGREKPLSPAFSRAVVQALSSKRETHSFLITLAPLLDLSAQVLFEKPFNDAEDFENSRKVASKILELRKRLLSSLDD